MERIKAADLVLIGLIVMLAGVLFTINCAGIRASSSGMLVITVDSESFGSYSLSENQVIPIGDGNTCEICDGEVRMISADCPDRYCVRSRPISRSNETIICLPNRVVLKIIDSGNDGLDTIAG